MSTKAESPSGLMDTLKLAVAAAFLIGGIGAYYYYDQESMLLRVVGVLVAAAIAMVIVYQTAQGRQLWRFIQGARVELRKVVWPTRQETLQTTLTVLVFVLILGIFFWLLDMGLLAMTRFVTRQGS